GSGNRAGTFIGFRSLCQLPFCRKEVSAVPRQLTPGWCWRHLGLRQATGSRGREPWRAARGENAVAARVTAGGLLILEQPVKRGLDGRSAADAPPGATTAHPAEP